MSGFSTIEGRSSKMKGPEKLLWYAASAAKAKSTSAATVLWSPPRPLDESAFLPLEASPAFLLLLIPLQGSGPSAIIFLRATSTSIQFAQSAPGSLLVSDASMTSLSPWSVPRWGVALHSHRDRFVAWPEAQVVTVA